VSLTDVQRMIPKTRNGDSGDSLVIYSKSSP
jgi:hypothetical protein